MSCSLVLERCCIFLLIGESRWTLITEHFLSRYRKNMVAVAALLQLILNAITLLVCTIYHVKHENIETFFIHANVQPAVSLD